MNHSDNINKGLSNKKLQFRGILEALEEKLHQLNELNYELIRLKENTCTQSSSSFSKTSSSNNTRSKCEIWEDVNRIREEVLKLIEEGATVQFAVVSSANTYTNEDVQSRRLCSIFQKSKEDYKRIDLKLDTNFKYIDLIGDGGLDCKQKIQRSAESDESTLIREKSALSESIKSIKNVLVQGKETGGLLRSQNSRFRTMTHTLEGLTRDGLPRASALIKSIQDLKKRQEIVLALLFCVCFFITFSFLIGH